MKKLKTSCPIPTLKKPQLPYLCSTWGWSMRRVGKCRNLIIEGLVLWGSWCWSRLVNCLILLRLRKMSSGLGSLHTYNQQRFKIEGFKGMIPNFMFLLLLKIDGTWICSWVMGFTWIAFAMRGNRWCILNEKAVASMSH